MADPGLVYYNRDSEGAIISPTPHWLHAPAATNLTDGDDDLSGGAETITISSTGDYTLSVYGTAAVTVAAGTATITGGAQATEGSDVTFSVSATGTVTLTLNSGTLDTHSGAAMKQVESGSFSTPFIVTSGSTATRTICNLKHPVDGAFDGDEGSLYMEIVFPDLDTDDMSDYGAGKYFDAGGDVAYRDSSDGSRVASNDGSAVAAKTFTNIAAGSAIKIRATWSKSGNVRYVGVDDEWSTVATHAGFTETLIELLKSFPVNVELHDLEVGDVYLTPAQHEARWP